MICIKNYKETMMANDNMKKLQSSFDPSYNSDEDLPTDAQTEIKKKEAAQQYNGADAVRQDAWKNAGTYPKLKRMVKGAWSGDTHE